MASASSNVSGISRPSVSGRRKESTPDTSATPPNMMEGSGSHTLSCEIRERKSTDQTPDELYIPEAVS